MESKADSTCGRIIEQIGDRDLDCVQDWPISISLFPVCLSLTLKMIRVVDGSKMIESWVRRTPQSLLFEVSLRHYRWSKLTFWTLTANVDVTGLRGTGEGLKVFHGNTVAPYLAILASVHDLSQISGSTHVSGESTPIGMLA